MAAYSPRMLVLEKLRALCQQDPAYRKSVRSHVGTPRPRDFIDICHVLDTRRPDLESVEALTEARAIFVAKRVPVGLLETLRGSAGFHFQRFELVRATMRAPGTLRSFEHYVGRVSDVAERLRKALGDV